MSRPSFDAICMGLAWMLAGRSTCARARIGAVIASADHRQVLAWGYNGNAAGFANDCDRHGPEAVGNCGCIHAEANAIVKHAAPAAVDKLVYVTTMPCVMCAKMIVNLGGVRRVAFAGSYRKTDGEDVLRRANIDLILVTIDPAALIVLPETP